MIAAEDIEFLRETHEMHEGGDGGESTAHSWTMRVHRKGRILNVAAILPVHGDNERGIEYDAVLFGQHRHFTTAARAKHWLRMTLLKQVRLHGSIERAELAAAEMFCRQLEHAVWLGKVSEMIAMLPAVALQRAGVRVARKLEKANRASKTRRRKLGVQR